MALYNAYFDESTSEGSPILVVAGFLAQEAQWAQFEREWKQVLKKHNLASFHMQHFARNKKQFRGMGEPQKRKILGDFLDVIKGRKLFGFAVIVHVRAFRRIMVGKVRQMVGSPYNLCAMSCHLLVGRRAKRYYQIEPIAYFFDAGHKNSKEVLASFLACKNHPASVEYRLGSLAFEHDNVLVPLQAADIAAYEIWRWLDAHFDGKQKHRRHPFLELIRNVPFTIREFDEEVLIELRDRKLGRNVESKGHIINRIDVLA